MVLEDDLKHCLPDVMKKKLILVTAQFPFGTSETFLETEILYLADAFSTIIILPVEITENKRPLPKNVIVDKSLSDYTLLLNENRKSRFLKGIPTVLANSGFYTQVRKQPGRYLHPTGFKRMAMWAREAELMGRFFKKYVTKQKLDTKSTLFYTYWFHLATVALGKTLTQAKLISRAHRFDLYDEEGNPPYSNWKCLGLQHLDKLFLISDDGLEYMKRRYPEQSPKYEVSRLGVKDPGVASKSSEDGVFRIISVAGVREVKRVNLIVSSLRLLSEQNPELKIRWDHFGDGPLMETLKQQVKKKLAGKAEVVLHGMVPNSEVMKFYKTNPVDLFINVSSSEGIPVSIMEAQAFGVPVMATDVGGTSEIVNDENGVLLTEHPEARSIADLLLNLFKNKDELNKKRAEAKKSWETRFQAENNYREFSQKLAEL